MFRVILWIFAFYTTWLYFTNNYIVTLDTKERLETFKKDLEKVTGATFGDIIFSQWEWYIVTVQLNSPEDMTTKPKNRLTI